MDFKEVKISISDFKAKPWKTSLEVLVLLILVVIIAYLNGFFEEKGKQHAASPNINSVTATVPKEAQPVKKTNSDNKVTIHQTIQGNQNPVIVSDGNVTIKYNTYKNKKE